MTPANETRRCLVCKEPTTARICSFACAVMHVIKTKGGK